MTSAMIWDLRKNCEEIRESFRRINKLRDELGIKPGESRQPTGNKMDREENDRLTAELKAEIEQEKAKKATAVEKSTAVEEADKASRVAKAAMEMKNPEVTRFPINDTTTAMESKEEEHARITKELAQKHAEKLWNGSEHYQELSIEPWAAQEAWMTPREFIGFLKGCAIKRLARTHSKGVELEDMVKAHHEMGKAIEILQKYNPE